MQSERAPGPQHTLPSPRDVVAAAHRTPTAINPCQSLVLPVLTELGKEGEGAALSSNVGHYQHFWVFIYQHPLCLTT